MADEIMVQNERAAIAINAATSLDMSTDEGFAKAFNATMAGDHKVEDCIGDTITLVDFYVEACDTVNEQTGEVEKMPHVVLIAEDGQTYEAFSVGMYTATSRLMTALEASGRDLHTAPIQIEFCERKAKRGKMFYFKIVG